PRRPRGAPAPASASRPRRPRCPRRARAFRTPGPRASSCAPTSRRRTLRSRWSRLYLLGLRPPPRPLPCLVVDVGVGYGDAGPLAVAGAGVTDDPRLRLGVLLRVEAGGNGDGGRRGGQVLARREDHRQARGPRLRLQQLG